MFDRDVWNGFNAKGLTTIFDNFGTRPFRGSDLSLLNLEGPISKTPISGTRAISLMSFNFSPLVPSVLKYININAVSLANNHTNNAGQSGFDNTKKVLTESGIKSFGLSAGVSDDSIIQVDGPIPLSIIGVDALSSFDEKAMETMISAEKKAGRFVLIFPHWGTEYAASHSSGQENLAKSWTTAGADMIVGSHPHVTEDFAMVNNKPVIYSLGNFVFDQFFSPETQRGLVLAGLVEKNKIVLSFLPTQEKTVRPEFLFGTQKADILNKILDNKSQLIKQIGNDTIEITR